MLKHLLLFNIFSTISSFEGIPRDLRQSSLELLKSNLGQTVDKKQLEENTKIIGLLIADISNATNNHSSFHLFLNQTDKNNFQVSICGKRGSSDDLQDFIYTMSKRYNHLNHDPVFYFKNGFDLEESSKIEFDITVQYINVLNYLNTIKYSMIADSKTWIVSNLTITGGCVDGHKMNLKLIEDAWQTPTLSANNFLEQFNETLHFYDKYATNFMGYVDVDAGTTAAFNKGEFPFPQNFANKKTVFSKKTDHIIVRFSRKFEVISNFLKKPVFDEWIFQMEIAFRKQWQVNGMIMTQPIDTFRNRSAWKFLASQDKALKMLYNIYIRNDFEGVKKNVNCRKAKFDGTETSIGEFYTYLMSLLRYRNHDQPIETYKKIQTQTKTDFEFSLGYNYKRNRTDVAFQVIMSNSFNQNTFLYKIEKIQIVCKAAYYYEFDENVIKYN